MFLTGFIEVPTFKSPKTKRCKTLYQILAHTFTAPQGMYGVMRVQRYTYFILKVAESG